MTWIDATHLAHEGTVIGYVVREGSAPEAGLFRELGDPDDESRPVVLVGAGCDCGWRSSRWRAEAVWQPYAVTLAQAADEERVHALWRRHLELDVIGGGVAGIGAVPRRVRS